jgi:hypothetical protein
MNPTIAYIDWPTKDYPYFVVTAHELKFDMIRQDTCWVPVAYRRYRLRKDAEAFAARYNNEE